MKERLCAGSHDCYRRTEGSKMPIVLGTGQWAVRSPRRTRERMGPPGRGGGVSLTCWEHGLPPGGKATGKCRARWGGTSRFFFSTAFSQCAVTHLFLSFTACERKSTGWSRGFSLQAKHRL